MFKYFVFAFALIWLRVGARGSDRSTFNPDDVNPILLDKQGSHKQLIDLNKLIQDRASKLPCAGQKPVEGVCDLKYRTFWYDSQMEQCDETRLCPNEIQTGGNKYPTLEACIETCYPLMQNLEYEVRPLGMRDKRSVVKDDEHHKIYKVPLDDKKNHKNRKDFKKRLMLKYPKKALFKDYARRMKRAGPLNPRNPESIKKKKILKKKASLKKQDAYRKTKKDQKKWNMRRYIQMDFSRGLEQPTYQIVKLDYDPKSEALAHRKPKIITKKP